MRAVAVLQIVAQVVGSLFSLWLTGSLGLSSWKAFRGECGTKRYGIERYYIDGSFFCERKR